MAAVKKKAQADDAEVKTADLPEELAALDGSLGGQDREGAADLGSEGFQGGSG